MSKLLLIDGTNVAYRWVKSPDQMLYKYAETVLSLTRSFDCSHVLVSFDNKGSSFRKDILPEYKAHRGKNLSEEQQAERTYFYEQVAKVPALLTDKDIPAVALEKVETDDVIAWICKHLHDKVDEIIIVSSDKDLYQLLIWDNVRIYSLIKQSWTTNESFVATYGITPELWVDTKAMMGDSSDNIPGIRLIGEKRALGYIKEFGPTYEDILEKLPKAQKKLGKIAQALIDGKEIVERNRKLMDLLTHVEEIIPEEYKEALLFYMQEEGIDV